MVTLPERTLEEVIAAYPTWRQSALSKADNCSLSSRFDLEGAVDFNTSASARGIIGHRAAAKILLTLQSEKQTEIDPEQALEILYECAAQRDVPDDQVIVLPLREQDLLRMGIKKLVYDSAAQKPRQFNMTRLWAVEERLATTVEYPHPDGGIVYRTITGQPDALLADPPNGMVVLDWKFSWGLPPAGDPNDEHVDDPAHVSYLGYFQQRFYALLVMRNYRAADHVRLREFYPFKGVARHATVLRSSLEHIEREIAMICERLDRGLMGGSESKLWKPSPGQHCGFCSAPSRCTLAPDVRLAQGGIATWDEAREAANYWVQMKRFDPMMRRAMKAWVGQHGPVEGKSDKKRWSIRFKPNKTGNGESFGIYAPEDTYDGPRDERLEGAFGAAAARAGIAA